MHAERTTLADVQRQVRRSFLDAGIEAGEIEARLLVGHVFEKDATSLIRDAGAVISSAQMAIVEQLVRRRLEGEPIGRVLGQVEFFGLEFEISSDTLQPRSDTEILVENVLQFLEFRNHAELRILDLGTGSGAIVISLLAGLPNASGIGCDISMDALDVAKNNAVRNRVDDRLELVLSNWCDQISGAFDIIVSNPPYIRADEIKKLAVEVRDHDPHVALDGGSDGLDAYRLLLDQTRKLLVPEGRLFLEIGYDQAAEVRCEAEHRGWRFAGLAQDLGGNERVIMFDVQ